jgi:hypothetical protein
MAMRGAGVVLKRAVLDVERHVATFEFELIQPDGSSVRLPIAIPEVSEITVGEQKRAAKWLQELFASWSEAAALFADAAYMGGAAATREAETEADAERGGGGA